MEKEKRRRKIISKNAMEALLFLIAMSVVTLAVIQVSSTSKNSKVNSSVYQQAANKGYNAYKKTKLYPLQSFAR